MGNRYANEAVECTENRSSTGIIVRHHDNGMRLSKLLFFYDQLYGSTVDAFSLAVDGWCGDILFMSV